MAIDDLLKLDKKSLKTYLKNKNIQSMKKSGYYFFDEVINDLKAKVIIYFFKNKVSQLIINIDTQNISFEDKYKIIQKYKEELHQKYGTPEFDNTNHIDMNNISITFTSEKENISIQGLNNYEDIQNSIIISINRKITISDKKYKNLWMWLIYFIGGVVFGLSMYFSLGDYNWQSFLICSIGGLVWGLLFGLGMEIFTPLFNKNIQFNKRIMKKIEKNQDFKKEDITLNGTLLILKENKKINRMLYLTAKAVIKDNEVSFYYYYLRKNMIIKVSLEEINKHIWQNRIEFELEGSKYYFQLLDPNEINVLKDYIAKHLYNNEEYEDLFNSFKQEIIMYNPYSVFNSHDNNFLDEEIAMLTRMIISQKIKTQEDLSNLLSEIFNEDYYYINALTQVYYNVIKNKYSTND